MKYKRALSIPVSCVALGALSACSSKGSTGFGTLDAATPVTTASTGSAVGSSGSGANSGTGAGSGSATGGSHTAGSSGGGADAGAGHGADAGPGNTGDPEPPDMVGMTAAHNAARAAVRPPATPALPPTRRSCGAMA